MGDGAEKLPDIAGKVHGIKSMDPLTVQCDDCLEVWTAEDEPMITTAHRVIFNERVHDPGLRLCMDCWRDRGWDNDISGWKEIA